MSLISASSSILDMFDDDTAGAVEFEKHARALHKTKTERTHDQNSKICSNCFPIMVPSFFLWKLFIFTK